MKGGPYLRGLLLDGRRRPIQPMAGLLGVDDQQSQQFLSSSAWPVSTVRAGPARRVVAVVHRQVCVVDDTGLPKPGVARQCSGTRGRVTNCRIGAGVHTASDTASCPLPWRLHLPRGWNGAQAPDRQARRPIPPPDPGGRAPPGEVAARAGHARASLRLAVHRI
ncbi:transposase [Streptomyces sp. NPDC001880]